MKNQYLLLSIILILSISFSKKNRPVDTPKTPTTPPFVLPPTPYVFDSSFKIVAYFPSYRDPEAISISKYKMITHLFYAFLNPNPDGTLVALEQPGRFNTIIARAKANGVKTGISVSGNKSNFVSKEKAVLVIPAYGKNATNTSKAYRDFVAANVDVTLDYATIDNVLLYFNGTLTTKKKAKLAKDTANGIMFWEFYHDDNGTKSIIKAANDELGRNYN